MLELNFETDRQQFFAEEVRGILKKKSHTLTTKVPPKAHRRDGIHQESNPRRGQASPNRDHR